MQNKFKNLSIVIVIFTMMLSFTPSHSQKNIVKAEDTIYSISGRVTDSRGNGIFGAVVSAVPNSMVGIDVLKPILMVTGWGGSVGKYLSTEDPNLSYLGVFLSSKGYFEGVNMFYASGTSPNLNQAANAEIVRHAICQAHAIYKEKFGISPVFNIIGHSYGGLRARAYLESSMYKNQERCPGTTDVIRVENLITLGTPHGGEWADHPLAFVLGLAGIMDTLLGQNNWPAMYELIPTVRDSQNRQSGGQPDGVTYHLVAGNAIPQKDNLSIVLRFLFDRSLTTKLIPNDLAVTQFRSFSLQNFGDLYDSMSLIGTNDIHGICDHETVGRIEGSICASFGLDDLQSYMHNSTTLESKVWPILDSSNKGLPVPIQTFILSALEIDNENSVLENVKTMTKSEEHGGLPVTEISSGVLAGSDIISGTFVVESGGTSQIHLGWLDEKISLTLIDPNGYTVADGDPGLIYSSFNMGMGWTTIYNFENIIPGTWSYQIQGVSLTKEIPFRFFQLPSSTINLSITLPEWQENGSDVIFIATVRADETTRIGGGTVIVSINKPDGTTENKPLFDDGAHDDQAAGDGIFGGAFENVTLGGIYGVTFTATGIYSTQSYTRNASGNFIIAPSAASFTSDYLDQGVDESGDSRYEWLEILVPVTVNSPGTYTLTGELYAGDTFMGLLKATGVWEIGSRNIALRLDSKTIFKLGLDGPYTLRNVLLTDESGITTQIKVDDPYYQTAIYAFTDFYYPEEVFLPLVNKNTLTSFTSGITFDLVDTNTKSTSAVFTDVNGYYTISDLPTGEYTLAASKTGKIFSNNPRTVNLSEDLTNQDFQEFSSFGETVFVPAGSFLMGCDPANNGGHGCPNRELPLHTVTLDAFYIDKYKVTNAKYAQCVESGNCATPAYNNSNTRSSYYGNPIYENYPVIYVDWNDATDYCTWAGKRLPSEAEWEKAARGTTVRAFPWGDQSPDCTLANFYTNGTTCVGDTSQVGIYPLGASPYGALDMAGNVWEWVNDWYSEEYYNITPSSNPPGPVSGTYKVLRSSNWREDSYGSRTSFRAPMSQYVHDNTLGFRCAVTDSSNHSPNQPSFPYPSNEAVNQSLNLTLSWIGGDQDGDSVSYDVYFELGDETPDIIVSNEQTTTYFSTEILSPESIYYWKIIAYDVHGAVTEGPVWYFTTDDGTLNPGEMVFIPAGSFPMGCDPAHNDGVTCPSNELPLHTVNLGAYYIDKYEMTNAQYAQCVSDGDCILPPSISSWDRDSYFGNPMYANYPVIYVDWYDATNYCTWAGKRLPSEAEWEKAARGTSIRAFPWGDQSPDCTLTNFYNGYCIGDTAQVGSYPMGASPYGVMDMAGNVWEWVNDWYSSSYYYVSPSSNPSGPIYGSSKVVRGGGWNYIADYLRTSTRNINYPHNHGYFAGFRCAFSQP